MDSARSAMNTHGLKTVVERIRAGELRRAERGPGARWRCDGCDPVVRDVYEWPADWDWRLGDERPVRFVGMTVKHAVSCEWWRRHGGEYGVQFRRVPGIGRVTHWGPLCDWDGDTAAALRSIETAFGPAAIIKGDHEV